MAVLISRKELLRQLEGVVSPADQAKLSSCLLDVVPDADRSDNAETWLSWIKCQSELKTVSYKVPVGILPSHLEGKLTDVKVQSHGPDDKVYDRNALFRRRVARGNCVLEVHNKATTEQSMDCVVFALKKFTGGLGDDDDRDIQDGFKWQEYFTKPISRAERVICTKKMNGEAAHFAVRWIENDFYIIAGSKNVHLLFRTLEDIDQYTDGRFLVARHVAKTCLEFFQAMEAERRSSLFSFFHQTKYTAVLEILLPHYQHVEDLSHLSAPELYFISWSKTDLAERYEEEICLPPDFGQKIALAFGMKVTGYDVVLHEHLTEKLTDIRKGYGYEGEVLYFIDKEGEVIGLLKKKTIWYILVRAIREKAKTTSHSLRKGSNGPLKLTETLAKTGRRLREIQKWLGLDDSTILAWQKLAFGFLEWLVKSLDEHKIESKNLFSLYPVIWRSFLKETEQTDDITLGMETLDDDKDNQIVKVVDNDYTGISD